VRAGAGSIIGTEAVSHAAPDGNTLLIINPTFVMNPHLRKVNYDPVTSFEPICYLVNAPTVIVVNSASPYRTLADLLDSARARPGDLTLAGSGLFYIAFEMLKRAANLNMTFVPYPGGAPAVIRARARLWHRRTHWRWPPTVAPITSSPARALIESPHHDRRHARKVGKTQHRVGPVLPLADRTSSTACWLSQAKRHRQSRRFDDLLARGGQPGQRQNRFQFARRRVQR
jgi:Tripartite tricarboxylate transporter family receptor